MNVTTKVDPDGLVMVDRVHHKIDETVDVHTPTKGNNLIGLDVISDPSSVKLFEVRDNNTHFFIDRVNFYFDMLAVSDIPLKVDFPIVLSDISLGTTEFKNLAVTALWLRDHVGDSCIRYVLDGSNYGYSKTGRRILKIITDNDPNTEVHAGFSFDFDCVRQIVCLHTFDIAQVTYEKPEVGEDLPKFKLKPKEISRVSRTDLCIVGFEVGEV